MKLCGRVMACGCSETNDPHRALSNVLSHSVLEADGTDHALCVVKVTMRNVIDFGVYLMAHESSSSHRPFINLRSLHGLVSSAQPSLTDPTLIDTADRNQGFRP